MCSGAYSLAVDDNPIQGDPVKSANRSKLIDSVGEQWRIAAVGPKKLPKEVKNWWATLFKNKETEVAEIGNNRRLCAAIINLLSASDSASYGIGIYFPDGSRTGKKGQDKFLEKADGRLLDTLNDKLGSTVCIKVHQSKGRVLPKMHTPQNGLTIRSFSHHLAFSVAPDISPAWLNAGVDDGDHKFNILVVPWPDVINPNQFRPSRKVNVSDEIEGASYGLFTYAASKGPAASFINRLITDAKRRIGPVDAIVFPELAMSEIEFARLSKTIGTGRLLVAGIGREAMEPFKSGQNEAILQVPVPFWGGQVHTQSRQSKHHRWKLTKSQVLQYGIGQNLHPSVNWWEHINLEHRTITFVTLREWLTTSVLICEDLARPDPIGDVLRAVGPNLIIALLCDAPQLIGRWPGRYAGALADDPGSSVLTVTSSGMANLSQPQPGRTNKCRTIALWRDAKAGVQEIELAPDAAAVLLNLTV